MFFGSPRSSGLLRSHADAGTQTDTNTDTNTAVVNDFKIDGHGDAETEAMLAHELAHIHQGDPLWNLLVQLVRRVLFLQPLNLLVIREIRRQMDFSADALAARTLGERLSLVRCLFNAGECLCSRSSESSVRLLMSGMSQFQSTLGQRVSVLLDTDNDLTPPTRLCRVATAVSLTLAALAIAIVAPRAVSSAVAPSQRIPSTAPAPSRSSPVNRHVASLAVLTGLAMPTLADEPARTPPNAAQVEKPAPTPVTGAAPTLKPTPDALPPGIRRFNGMLVGRVTAKDVEKGSFVVQVDAVPRVWNNSAAEDPRSLIGKTVQIGGVFGKFLDVLVVTRIGETVEFECKHDGERLVFPGELLRKVAPFDPADYPVLPETFRGFQGAVAGEILKKDSETMELIVRVDRVVQTWDGSKAKEPKSIEGKLLMLAGFWNRRDAYNDLRVGDKIEAGMRHIGLRSDHLTVAESIRKSGQSASQPTGRPETAPRRAAPRNEMEQSAEPQRGFRGLLVGRIVEKDVERGTFTVTVDAVPRVWENNQAKAPKALLGRNVAVEGVTGRMIDALVVAKTGDTIEFGAFNNDGARLRVGEVLRKVGPVTPGDYPVLPDEFRGYKGMITAKVVRKRSEWMEAVIEVVNVGEPFEGNKAREPRAMIGKQAMLAGFWNRKDDFHGLEIGDVVRCGVTHPQLLSDHLVVAEAIRKVDPK
jgi:hypothetical protein